MPFNSPSTMQSKLSGTKPEDESASLPMSEQDFQMEDSGTNLDSHTKQTPNPDSKLDVPLDFSAQSPSPAPASTATATSQSQLSAAVPPAATESSTPKPKHRAPSPPRWRFVAEAKKTSGYSSLAAGNVILGKSAQELGAKYTPPAISTNDNEEKRVATREVGRLWVREWSANEKDAPVGEGEVSLSRRGSEEVGRERREWGVRFESQSEAANKKVVGERDASINIDDTDVSEQVENGVGKLPKSNADSEGEDFDGKYVSRKQIDDAAEEEEKMNATDNGIDNAEVEETNVDLPSEPDTDPKPVEPQLETFDETQMSQSDKSSLSHSPDKSSSNEVTNELEDGRPNTKSVASFNEESKSDNHPQRKRRKLLLGLLLLLLIPAVVAGVLLGNIKSNNIEKEAKAIQVPDVNGAVGAALPFNTTVPSLTPTAQPSSFPSPIPSAAPSMFPSSFPSSIPTTECPTGMKLFTVEYIFDASNGNLSSDDHLDYSVDSNYTISWILRNSCTGEVIMTEDNQSASTRTASTFLDNSISVTANIKSLSIDTEAESAIDAREPSQSNVASSGVFQRKVQQYSNDLPCHLASRFSNMHRQTRHQNVAACVPSEGEYVFELTTLGGGGSDPSFVVSYDHEIVATNYNQSIEANVTEKVYFGEVGSPCLTKIPSAWPTSSPSDLPSSVPSLRPSSTPSKHPSSAPSLEPSLSPTLTPSAHPTNIPSHSPSTLPSTLPTIRPSSNPSQFPSLGPTRNPTEAPTTGSPTRSPVANIGGCPNPYAALQYYVVGTQVSLNDVVYECTSISCGSYGFEPGSNSNLWKDAWKVVATCEGTLTPTITPTSIPSSIPSSLPNYSPSGFPTEMPSSSPSFAPSNTLSQVPSSQPSSTNYPSDIPTLSPSLHPVTRSPTLPFLGGCPERFDPENPYHAIGEQVSVEGVVLECKSYGCGSYGFEPGAENGSLWLQAWDIVGTCSGTIAPTSSPSTISPTTPSPTASPSLIPSTSFMPTVKVETPFPTSSGGGNLILSPTESPTQWPSSTSPTSQPSEEFSGAPSRESSMSPSTAGPTVAPTSNPTVDFIEPLLPTSPCVSENNDFNLCFAIDMSGSICSGAFIFTDCQDCEPSIFCNDFGIDKATCCNNFLDVANFAKDVVLSLRELPSNQSFSIVQFSTGASIVSDLASADETLENLDRLVYTGGTTNQRDAIRFCQQTLDASSNPERKNLILMITDGEPTSPWIRPEFEAQAAATDAKESGTFIIPVLISPSNYFSRLNFMSTISSDGNVFNVEDFDDLIELNQNLFATVSCNT